MFEDLVQILIKGVDLKFRVSEKYIWALEANKKTLPESASLLAPTESRAK